MAKLTAFPAAHNVLDTLIPRKYHPAKFRPDIFLEMTSFSSDLNIESIEKAQAGRVIGSEILHFDTVGSTMDVARDYAENGTPEGLVVIAEEQTKGRGRFNRNWVSPRGQNLSFSVVLKPSPEQLAQMNMAATLAVSKTFADVAGLKPAIKWPNDVRINGRKASGILIETAISKGEVDFAIVGIGVNVNFDPSQFDEVSSIATSIYRETGKRSDRTQVLKTLLTHFDDLYRGVREGGSLRDDWAGQLETLGRTIELRWQEQVVHGLAESVDEQGNLLIARPDGTIFTAIAGEVTSQV